jgi:hypothetical protein
MQYKVIHSADLQKDLTEAAAEGWELFDVAPHRQPGTPALWIVIMERDETTAMDFTDSIVLERIRSWAASKFVPAGTGNEHTEGYEHAQKDVREYFLKPSAAS